MVDKVAYIDGAASSGGSRQKVPIKLNDNGDGTWSVAMSESPTTITFDSEKITVGAAAVGFTGATIAPVGQDPASSAYVTVESASIRIQTDGTDPDSTTGHLVQAGGSFAVSGVDDIAALRMIRVSTDATVQVTYGR